MENYKRSAEAEWIPPSQRAASGSWNYSLETLKTSKSSKHICLGSQIQFGKLEKSDFEGDSNTCTWIGTEVIDVGQSLGETGILENRDWQNAWIMGLEVESKWKPPSELIKKIRSCIDESLHEKKSCTISQVELAKVQCWDTLKKGQEKQSILFGTATPALAQGGAMCSHTLL